MGSSMRFFPFFQENKSLGSLIYTLQSFIFSLNYNLLWYRTYSKLKHIFVHNQYPESKFWAKKELTRICPAQLLVQLFTYVPFFISIPSEVVSMLFKKIYLSVFAHFIGCTYQVHIWNEIQRTCSLSMRREIRYSCQLPCIKNEYTHWLHIVK